jgi:hypothetical protein
MHFLRVPLPAVETKGFNYYRISVVNVNFIEGGKQSDFSEMMPKECSSTIEQKSALVSFPRLSPNIAWLGKSAEFPQ